ncbi:unnamed protein product [Closterium sp. NIES-53]
MGEAMLLARYVNSSALSPPALPLPLPTPPSFLSDSAFRFPPSLMLLRLSVSSLAHASPPFGFLHRSCFSAFPFPPSLMLLRLSVSSLAHASPPFGFLPHSCFSAFPFPPSLMLLRLSFSSLAHASPPFLFLHRSCFSAFPFPPSLMLLRLSFSSLAHASPTKSSSPTLFPAPLSSSVPFSTLCHTFSSPISHLCPPCHAMQCHAMERHAMPSRPTPRHQIADHFQGRLPGLLGSGTRLNNFVHVNDVVLGLLAAHHRGTPGRRYILGGENASMVQLFQAVQRATGKAPPRLRLPLWLVAVLGWVSVLVAKMGGPIPIFTHQSVRAFNHDWAYSSEQAQQDLEYSPLSLEEGLRDTLTWMRAVGAIK